MKLSVSHNFPEIQAALNQLDADIRQRAAIAVQVAGLTAIDAERARARESLPGPQCRAWTDHEAAGGAQVAGRAIFADGAAQEIVAHEAETAWLEALAIAGAEARAPQRRGGTDEEPRLPSRPVQEIAVRHQAIAFCRMGRMKRKEGTR